jgi:hypothetical protein
MDKILDFIFLDSSDNAITFALWLSKKIQSLEYFPNSGKRFPYSVRAKIYKSHYIIYEIDEPHGVVEITTVVSCRNYKAYKKYL